MGKSVRPIIVLVVVLLVVSFLGSANISSAVTNSCPQDGQLAGLPFDEQATSERALELYNGLKDDQHALAKQIIDYGQTADLDSLGFELVGPVDAELLRSKLILAATATAWQESKIRDLVDGDRDSVNAFQMRPSIGPVANPYWGTLAELLNPDYYIPRHYEEYARLSVDDILSMSVFELALEIQRPSYIAYLNSWDRDATEEVAQLLISTYSEGDLVFTDGSFIECAPVFIGDLGPELIGSYPAEGNWGGYTNGRHPESVLAEVAPGHYLRPDAAYFYLKMAQAAQEDGVQLVITDSYRTYDEQVSCVQRKGLYRLGGLCADVGSSDHGLGKAVDMKTGRSWLAKNADRWCFFTIPREPWHFELRLDECDSEAINSLTMDVSPTNIAIGSTIAMSPYADDVTEKFVAIAALSSNRTPKPSRFR